MEFSCRVYNMKVVTMMMMMMMMMMMVECIWIFTKSILRV